MKCEMNYCIYNKDFLCMLNETRLNALGLCEECMLVTIPDKTLSEWKSGQLEEILNRRKDDGSHARMNSVALGENLE